jgi:hypothetical protein
MCPQYNNNKNSYEALSSNLSTNKEIRFLDFLKLEDKMADFIF